MSRNHEPVEIENVYCLDETPRAIKVRLEDGDQFWVPQSLISEDSEVYGIGDEGTLVVPRWFAEEKGLVPEE